jgi:hypothetical protein
MKGEADRPSLLMPPGESHYGEGPSPALFYYAPLAFFPFLRRHQAK